MPQPFSAVLVKGRSNYLSLRRLRGAQQRAGGLLFDRAARWSSSTQIGRWARQTHDGSRSDLDFQPQPAVWDLVESDSGNCLGRSCPDYDAVLLLQGPQAACTGPTCSSSTTPCSSATSPCAAQDASLLPDYKVVIFDEAHTLEDVAADHLGLQISRGAVDYLLNKLLPPARQPRRACSPSTATRTPAARSMPPAPPATASSTRCSSGSPAAAAQRQSRPAGPRRRRRRPRPGAEHRRRPALRGTGAARRAASTRSPTRTVRRGQDRAGLGRATAASNWPQALRQWLGQELEGQVYWVEASGERTPAHRPGQRPHRGRPGPAGTAVRQGADRRHDQRHAQRRRPRRLPPLPGPPRPGRLRRRCSSAARSTTASRPSCTCSAHMPDPSADPDKLRGGGPRARSRSTSDAPRAGRSCCSPATA